MLTVASLHAAVVEHLSPVVRYYYTYPAGNQELTEHYNSAGLDLHHGHTLGPVAHDHAGTVDEVAHPYVWLRLATGERHTRLGGGSAIRDLTLHMTVAAGDEDGLTWALDLLLPRLARARIHERAGLLVPLLDQVTPLTDEDVTPHRVWLPLQYRTDVH